MGDTMKWFTVKAVVSVDVEIAVRAKSSKDARKMFGDQICMTACLIDTPGDVFEVHEDSISEVADLRITENKDWR